MRNSNEFFRKHSSWWRRLEDIFRLHLQRTSSRHLQDVFIKTNIFPLLIRLQKKSSRLLQDVLIKTNILVLVIRPQDVLQNCLQDIFKTSSRRFEDVFKAFSRRIIKLNCSCQQVFKMSSRYIQNVSDTSFKDAYL